MQLRNKLEIQERESMGVSMTMEVRQLQRIPGNRARCKIHAADQQAGPTQTRTSAKPQVGKPGWLALYG